MKNTIDTLVIGAMLIIVMVPGLHKEAEKAQREALIKEAYAKPAPAPDEHFVLAELYTSENCSHCPPAYDIAKNIIEEGKEKNKKIYVLDFHVDYWNDKGWSDPYSSAAYSKRQEKYARVFSEQGVYTPQLILNGKKEVVGSNKLKAETEVAAAYNEASAYKLSLSNAVVKDGQKVMLDYTLNEVPANANLNFVIVEEKAISKVLNGANKGKTLVHHNVVRQLSSAHADIAKKGVTLEPYTFDKASTYSLVSFVQDTASLAILAADSKPLLLK